MRHVVRTHISLAHTDAAGILFYGRIFDLTQAAAEDLLRTLGHPIDAMLSGPWILPLVHAEADYSAPLRAGDAVTIEIRAEAAGASSLSLDFTFKKDGREAAHARTVQVAVDRATFQKIPLPAIFADRLRAET